MHFTGLSTKDQFMTLTAAIQGPVADMLPCCGNPRLKLLDKHPVAIKNPAGTVAGKLEVDMPLKKEVQFEQVKIAAQGRLSALRLGGLVAGRDLDSGDIQFDVTQDGMKVSGPATVAEHRQHDRGRDGFPPGPPTQVLQQATLDGRATARDDGGRDRPGRRDHGGSSG